MLQIMRKMFYKRMTKRFVLATLALLLCSASVSASDGDQQDGKNSERAVGAVEGGVQLGVCESLSTRSGDGLHNVFGICARKSGIIFSSHNTASTFYYVDSVRCLIILGGG